MAIINRPVSFSQVFLAPPVFLLLTFFLSCQAQANDICDSADYKTLCRATLHGINEPVEAIEAAIRHVIQRTEDAMTLSKMMGHDQNDDICKQMYGDVISDLKESIEDLKKGDEDTLNTNLSAAISYFSTCDDAFAEMGEVTPLIRVNTVLEHMIDNTLAIVPLMHNN